MALFESRMADTLASASSAEQLPHEVFKISAGLSLLAQALHDPDVNVRAVLSYSPQPNVLQREQFVRAYLDADRPKDALTWLHQPWDSWEETRKSLLSDTLGRLGRFDESAPIRQEMFERTLSVFCLQRWLEHLPEASRGEAMSRARQLALDHDDLTTAATLLLEIGDAEAAEDRLVSDPPHIDGKNYPALVPLAQGLRSHGSGEARPSCTARCCAASSTVHTRGPTDTRPATGPGCARSPTAVWGSCRCSRMKPSRPKSALDMRARLRSGHT